MQLAKGSGCAKVFRCTYHGWAYRLDGRLEYVPDDYGFPDLDKSTHGLVPVHDVAVKGGLVFVTQDVPIGKGALESLPDLLAPDQAVFDSRETVSEVNWKLQAEGTLEGYHIKHTHPETFYPYGFDNLNVIETQGPNVRVCFPFRRIEKLRDVPRDERALGRTVTLVNHIFPAASITRLSDHFTVSFAEPESPFRTRYYSYKMTMPTQDGAAPSADAVDQAKKDAAFLADTGLKEDAEVIQGIQAAIGSGANTHYTFGRFESAIVHLHKNLTLYLDRLAAFERGEVEVES
jgi:phenylpropionate dioxygenase-like ring-hydroxylating dioxygenase large terminal subunit